MYECNPGYEGALLWNTEIHKSDIAFLREFLTECKFINGFRRCLNPGAGVLRETLEVLSYYFDIVDVNDIANLDRVWANLEPEFTDGKLKRRKRCGKLGEKYANMNMIDIPFDQTYNAIIVWWGFEYLYNDHDLLNFLEKAKQSLVCFNKKAQGTIIFKVTLRDFGNEQSIVGEDKD